MLKYSRQREAIKDFLMTRKDHPTADVVYSNVRTEFPNISLVLCTEILRCWQILVKLQDYASVTVSTILTQTPVLIITLSAATAEM